MPADGKRICSIVRADATMAVDASDELHKISGDKLISMRCSACAEPQSGFDTALPGIMRLSFQDGLVPGIKTMRDLLTNYKLSQARTDLLTAIGGDYPVDSNTSLVAINATDKACSLNQMFACGFFDWLRSTHNKPRLDAIIKMVDTPFDQLNVLGSGNKTLPSFLFEFDKEGNLIVTNERCTPFSNEVVYHNQLYSLDLNGIIESGNVWAVSFRDHVHNLGTSGGGKHGGESMPGNPINWCELPDFDGNGDIAALKQKGCTARGLIAQGSSQGTIGGSSAIATDTAYFKGKDYSQLPNQPRKNYYSGGLAVDFRISAPRPIEIDNPLDTARI